MLSDIPHNLFHVAMHFVGMTQHDVRQELYYNLNSHSQVYPPVSACAKYRVTTLLTQL